MTITEALETIERNSTRSLEELDSLELDNKLAYGSKDSQMLLLGWHRARVSTAQELLSMIKD